MELRVFPPRDALAFDASLHPPYLPRPLGWHRVAKYEVTGDGEKAVTQRRIAGDDARFGECLKLPRLAVPVVVRAVRVERSGERSLIALGSQAHVDSER